ncbi:MULTISPECIES: chorismate synthase [Sphingobacterium]|jgi:chorismate synthase|uniref:Chorismate synthase n=2 Tax=Sphingobacterium TaxID=28453 RepID=A0ABW5YXA7_9SPHI|nr:MULTISPECIES: chorismate synthase [Sphingobacterium]KKX51895.1 chorismate synthase [Sphingobacterium sp. IITKGP-BTPF85]MBB2949642.1 chorismate synthase [Sphingobacterium sp. JUb56]MCW2263511.1 chorismate synthase [Sphingobacterium kitahiroshimense]QQD14199.1 chorismate synthase [Sphingobacterium sp. UDSM-2020]TCR05945.1 chorismate synthase [Sphingobacterium sp. JUb78]
MAGNSFGDLFRISTFGESHGKAIGVILDGCPPNIAIDEDFIQSELDKRKPGQSKITTQRKESDTAQILSGVFEGKSTGTPIAILIPNEDQRSKDYSHIKDIFRPSHADYTYHMKYGHRDYRGGGRSSARETAARVAAGAIAKSFLKQHGIEIFAHVSGVGKIESPNLDTKDLEALLDLRESNIARCADPATANEMIEFIDAVRKSGDTVGGRISTIIRNVPVGLGEPVFDKLHADLAKAMMSINAVHGFEYGSGFAGSELLGSQHNDLFVSEEHDIHRTKTHTNFSGGIQGGISNGMDITFKTAFKPVATIMRDQQTIDSNGNEATVQGKGRHDPCVVSRAVIIVEAMAALVIADHLLKQSSYKNVR